MKTGKLPEAVLLRSVIKQFEHRRDEVLLGPAAGQDCAALCVAEDEAIILSTDPITGATRDIGRLAVYITTNDLAAGGAEPVGIMLTIMLPEYVQEQELASIIKDVEETCNALQIEVLGGHTEVTGVVRQPLLSVTGVGKVKKDRILRIENVRPGQDLIVTKWIGLEATTILAKEKYSELSVRFSPEVLDAAAAFDQYLSVIPEAQEAMQYGVSAMHDITEGGVFGALWEMTDGAGVGVEVDLKKIPIRQETVEICEFFDLNPYQIMSSGSMMIAADDGEQLVELLARAGIHAAVIGHTTPHNDRIIRNGDDVRYLDKPQTDELYKVVG